MPKISKVIGDRTERWLLELRDSNLLLSDLELEELAEAIVFKIRVVYIDGKGSTGVEAETSGRNRIHLCHNDELSELIESLSC